VAGLKLVQIGVFEQRFALKLRVQNPNDVELRINGLSVEIELNGQPFSPACRTRGDRPAFRRALLEVMATSTLGSALKQLRELQKGGRELDYRIVGRSTSPGSARALRARGDLQTAGGRQSIAQALASRDPRRRTYLRPRFRAAGIHRRSASGLPGERQDDQLVPAGMMVVVSGFAFAGEQDETRFDFGDRFDRDVKGAAISAATAFNPVPPAGRIDAGVGLLLVAWALLSPRKSSAAAKEGHPGERGGPP
jgi:hypothetical protein